jgi:ABC-type phosphate transport system substrate-binding protein
MRVQRLIALLLLTSPAPLAQAQARAPSFRVIVNPSNPSSTVDRHFLLDVFLKRATRWDNGEATHPVDLSADSPARRKFSSEVLGRPVSAIQSFWQQAIFSGRDVPPPELETEEAVVQYVLKHRGGVGYVSDGTDISAVKSVVVK